MDIEKIKSIQPIATKKKRHRRTKAEMELAKQQQQQGESKKKNKKDDYWDSYEHKMITTDEVAEQMIKNAINKHLPEPDFDYRKEYAKGQIVWFLDYNKVCNTVDLLELKINTVYSRVLIAYIDNGEARCIDYGLRDFIFTTPSEAETMYKQYKHLVNSRKSKNESGSE